jgi:hypothetical protein
MIGKPPAVEFTVIGPYCHLVVALLVPGVIAYSVRLFMYLETK